MHMNNVCVFSLHPNCIIICKYMITVYQENRGQLLNGSLNNSSTIGNVMPPSLSPTPNNTAKQTQRNKNHNRSLLPRNITCRYDCHESLDKQWGAVVNGQWTGMIKEVLDGTADVAVAALSMTNQRYSVVDFLTGMISSRYGRSGIAWDGGGNVML